LDIYQQDVILSGDCYGVIRIWKYTQPGVFSLQTTINGHASKISGIVVVKEIMIWSSSTDCSIRLWDYATGECKFLITQNMLTNGIHSGHVNAVTGLLTYEMPSLGTFVFSSSMDGKIKVWNGSNGNCVATKDHCAGVVSMMTSQDPFSNPILVLGLEKR
jgi:WD40 repeat protein